MSFGLHDKDWVDPDPVETIKCCECEEWKECPWCGKWGWCTFFSEFTERDGECDA